MTENTTSSEVSPSLSADDPGDLSDAHRAPDDGLNLLQLISLLLSRWRVVVGLPVITALLVAVITFIVPVTFTATTTFVPEVRSQGRLPSGLAGLAGQFGLSLGVDATQSPRFYADLVKSREVLERILLSQYRDPLNPRNASDSTTLLRILRVKGRDAADSLYRGTKVLDALVSARVDKQTNVVSLSVDANHAVLAAAVANRLVAYLNDFNAKTRQSQARERRKFIEDRLADGEQELRTAEESLRIFYERNRSWQQSPQLVFEEGRRRRQVDIRQELYLTLRREYETARIEEVNDTPIITVIDRAVPPQEKSRPKRRLLVMLAFVLGGTFAVIWATGAEFFDRARRHQRLDYQEFSNLLRRVRSEITHTVHRR